MKNQIQCPNCGHNFDVEEALSGKLEAQYKADFEQRLSQELDRFNKDKSKLEDLRQEILKEKENQDQLLKQKLDDRLKSERNRLQKEVADNYEDKLKLLQEENNKRLEENKLLKNKELELIKQESKLREKEEEMNLQIQKQLLEKQKEFDVKSKALIEEQSQKFESEKRELKLKLEKEQSEQKQRADEELQAERNKIQQRIAEDFELKLKSLEEENKKRKDENKVLKEKEIDLLKQQNELKDREEQLNIELQKQLLEKQNEIEEKARSKERESFELEKVKLLKQIEDNKKLAEEMKRKAEQGSMQLQGEVQELAIEELLGRVYPFDIIQEVPKGVRGADSIQIVKNSVQQNCGSIVYESKRTKNFANDWIDKLKQDQVTCKADIAVLVTQTMPSGMERFGEKDGVWICGFHELKSLSYVLRMMLVKTHSVKLSQENKGDKMEMLYAYLTSNEFVQNVKRIVEVYDNQRAQLESEKRAMQRIWAQREKQIEVVQTNISSLFGSIGGIAGNELPGVEMLEL